MTAVENIITKFFLTITVIPIFLVLMLFSSIIFRPLAFAGAYAGKDRASGCVKFIFLCLFIMWLMVFLFISLFIFCIDFPLACVHFYSSDSVDTAISDFFKDHNECKWLMESFSLNGKICWYGYYSK